MTIDPVLVTILSDLFVNLTAGWYGVVFIVPFTSEKPRKLKVRVLTVNLILGTLSLLTGWVLKKF